MQRRLILTLALFLPTAALAGPREDWQPVVEALRELGPIGQVDHAQRLEEALEAIPDSDLDALRGEVNLAELADAILISAAARDNAEDALVEADVAVVESLSRQGFVLPPGFSVRQLIRESSLSGEGVWRTIQSHARPLAPGDGLQTPHSATMTIGPSLPTGPGSSFHSAGFPSADAGYPSSGFPVLCVNSPGRANSDDMIVATNAIAIARNGVVVGRVAIEIGRGALEAGKVVWSGASRACDQTGVIAGFGGNASLVCIAVDIVFAVLEGVQAALEIGVGIAGDIVNVAEDVVKHINNCDAAVADAEIEASYKRLDHIHDDLSVHEMALAAHDLNIDADLIAHDANIDADLIVHDANIDADLIAHDANIDADLIAHDANIDADLVAHDALMTQEHDELLRLLRAQQIEIVLTSGLPPPQFAMPGGPEEDPADVAGNETCPGLAPAGLVQVYSGGSFERVRCITRGSIDRMASLGHDTHVAERHFADGELDWMNAPPDFRAAVKNYAKAMSVLMTPGSPVR